MGLGLPSPLSPLRLELLLQRPPLPRQLALPSPSTYPTCHGLLQSAQAGSGSGRLLGAKFLPRCVTASAFSSSSFLSSSSSSARSMRHCSEAESSPCTMTGTLVHSAHDQHSPVGFHLYSILVLLGCVIVTLVWPRHTLSRTYTHTHKHVSTHADTPTDTHAAGGPGAGPPLPRRPAKSAKISFSVPSDGGLERGESPQARGGGHTLAGREARSDTGHGCRQVTPPRRMLGHCTCR